MKYTSNFPSDVYKEAKTILENKNQIPITANNKPVKTFLNK